MKQPPRARRRTDRTRLAGPDRSSTTATAREPTTFYASMCVTCDKILPQQLPSTFLRTVESRALTGGLRPLVSPQPVPWALSIICSLFMITFLLVSWISPARKNSSKIM